MTIYFRDILFIKKYLLVYLFVCLFVCLLVCLFDVTARVVHNVENKTSWLSQNMTNPQNYLFDL